jgi:hypothetical protein
MIHRLWKENVRSTFRSCKLNAFTLRMVLVVILSQLQVYHNASIQTMFGLNIVLVAVIECAHILGF